MKVNTAGIPQSLRSLRQWVSWRLEPGGAGKPRKVPYNPVTGARASVADPATWATFDQAIADNTATGVGFVLTGQDDFVALDLDSVLVDGVPEGWAAELLKKSNTFVEVSQSGKGLHIIGRSKELRSSYQHKYDAGSLEVYYRGRYIAMTGELYEGSTAEPLDCNSLVLEIVSVPGTDLAVTRYVKSTAEEIAERCAWLAHCRDDADTLPEPEWYAMLSIVGRTSEGASVAHMWSQDHPKYSEQDTASKLNRALLSAGPRTCAGVAREFGDQFCHACSLNGKIKSPLHALGKAPQAKIEVKPGQSDPATLIDGFHRTDKGNADRVIKAHGVDILSYHAWSHPLVWTGAVWANGQSNIVEFAKDTAQGLFDLLEHKMEAEEAVTHFKWASDSESARKISNMVDLVLKDPRVQLDSPDRLNSDPMLLSCRNCTVDLRTGEARGHRRSDWITEQADVDYEEGATARAWSAFLSSSVQAESVTDYLQRAAGYSLTGSVIEKVLFFLHGKADSGKTTFVKTLSKLLGSYGKPIPQEMLMAKQFSSHPTEVASLFACRMAVASETEEGHRLNEALVKLITGGDMLSARRMREDFWNFTPTHKLWVVGNHKPVIRGTDDAIWNRISIVPFFPPPEIDQALGPKLSAEGPGILNWMIDGCLQWQKQGLNPPDEVVKLKEAYRREQDSVAQFLLDTVADMPGGRLEKNSLYRAYKNWSEQTMGDRWPMVREAFNRRLSEKGVATEFSDGTYYWVDVTLREILVDLRRTVEQRKA